MEDKIKVLKQLIDDYEFERNRLNEMINLWEVYDDPSGDIGLQFEQSNIVEGSYEEIKKFVKTL